MLQLKLESHFLAQSAWGDDAIEIMRKGEALFKELSLSQDDRDDSLIVAMAARPILFERPIVFAQDRATLGRPPEAALEIL